MNESAVLTTIYTFVDRYYLKCYMYLAQMEALNIPYTLEMFISSPKEGMIKGLWKNHSNEPQVDIANMIETRDAQYLGKMDITVWVSNFKFA